MRRKQLFQPMQQNTADKEDVTELMSSSSSLKSKMGSLQEISIFSLLTSPQKQASLEVNFVILIFKTLHHTHIHHFWVFSAALFPEGVCKTSIL